MLLDNRVLELMRLMQMVTDNSAGWHLQVVNDALYAATPVADACAIRQKHLLQGPASRQ